MQRKFLVSGMTCSACQAHVEKAVSRIPGVHSAVVNLLQNILYVDYDGDKLVPADIVSAVRRAGYDVPSEKQNTAPQALAQAQAETLKMRFWFSLGFLLPLMYVNMGRISACWHNAQSGHLCFGAIFAGTSGAFFKPPIFYARAKTTFFRRAQYG